MQIDRWIGVALESQVPRSSSSPATVDGQYVAVWRGADKRVNVWENRCPHRGMPLSFGFVRENTIRCLYHGWTFDSDGRCKNIPAHPELMPPKTICAKSFHAEVQYGIVWANLAEQALAPLHDLGVDEGWTSIRSIFLERSAPDVRNAFATSGLPGSATKIKFQNENTAVADTYCGLRLLIAIQPIADRKTGLHITAKGDAALTAADRLNLSRSAERFRNTMELG